MAHLRVTCVEKSNMNSTLNLQRQSEEIVTYLVQAQAIPINIEAPWVFERLFLYVLFY